MFVRVCAVRETPVGQRLKRRGGVCAVLSLAETPERENGLAETSDRCRRSPRRRPLVAKSTKSRRRLHGGLLTTGNELRAAFGLLLLLLLLVVLLVVKPPEANQTAVCVQWPRAASCNEAEQVAT